VYRAWDTRLDREVALKLLPAEVDDAAGRTSAIIDEGRLLARVHHPNVVTLYGAEQIADHVGLWMELIEGKTLGELLDGGKAFTPSEVRHIGVELCHAMTAVHGAGLLHRDIKAHNVMLADAGRVVLMDFGTGRELDHPSAGPVAGTPLYLAPEIFSGVSDSVRSDIYSAGVLLYRLLTGTYPGGGPRAARSPVGARTRSADGTQACARRTCPGACADRRSCPRWRARPSLRERAGNGRRPGISRPGRVGPHGAARGCTITCRGHPVLARRVSAVLDGPGTA